jgi:hypothetical protein
MHGRHLFHILHEQCMPRVHKLCVNHCLLTIFIIITSLRYLVDHGGHYHLAYLNRYC